MASKPALWPPETTSFGKGAAASSVEGQVGVPDRPPAAEHRHERDGGGEELGRELVGVAPDGLEEADDPLLVGKVQVPDAANARRRATAPVGDPGPRRRRRARAASATGRFGTASGGEHDAEAAVGVTDEMGAVAHQFGDVVGVDARSPRPRPPGSGRSRAGRAPAGESPRRPAVAGPPTLRRRWPMSRARARPGSRHPPPPRGAWLRVWACSSSDGHVGGESLVVMAVPLVQVARPATLPLGVRSDHTM